MRIVDAQIHLWGSGLPSNMAHRQVTSFTTEEALGLMDAGGVDAAVIHPPGWDPNADEMAFKAVRDFPGRFAILGAFPLNQPDKRTLVDTWRSRPGMLGLRYGFLQEPMRGWLADGTLEWLWAAAERAGVPIAMLATDSLPHIGRIAERHPGLRLTIDHLGGRGGTTTLKDAAAMEHMPELIAHQAGEASERGDQGDRRAGLLQRAVSVHEHAPVPAPDLRRVRAGAHVLGHRHHEDAVLLAAVRDDVHRGTALAVSARQGARHGPGRVRLMGLEPAGLISADSDDEVGPVPGQRDRAGEIAPDVALDLREHRRGMDRKCVKTCSRSGE